MVERKITKQRTVVSHIYMESGDALATYKQVLETETTENERTLDAWLRTSE